MKSPAEIVDMAEALANGTIAVDMVDWTGWSDDDQNTVLMGALFIIRHRKSKKPQRRAMRLLRSWITDEERATLRRRGNFVIRGSNGGRYRIRPHGAGTELVRRHGKRDFAIASFCLHPDTPLPQADIALAHYLLILTDESAFRSKANMTVHDMLWNGEWARRLRAARRERGSA